MDTSNPTLPPTLPPSGPLSNPLQALTLAQFQKRILLNPWIPHKPHHKQALFLLHDHVPEVFYGGAVGGAKALATDTPLPMPSGWTTMGAVRPGEWLLAGDGKPCRVLFCSEVWTDHDCYAVQFSDGAVLTADSGHRWLTRRTSDNQAWTYQQPVGSGHTWLRSQVPAAVLVGADGSSSRNGNAGIAGEVLGSGEASDGRSGGTAERELHCLSHNCPCQKDSERVNPSIWTTEELAATVQDGHEVDGPEPGQVRRIVSVRRVASVPVRCVAVDSPSHLYLAGCSLIPTHNTDAMLMAALQYCDVPGYSALILRRTYPQLSKADAIMERSKQWGLKEKGAHWNGDTKTWTFPSGAKLEFGHCQNEDDKYNFQGSAYQFVGVDEVTAFTESQYTFLFSRTRRPDWICGNCNHGIVRTGEGWTHKVPNRGDVAARCDRPAPGRVPSAPDGLTVQDVPLRTRATSNPGASGHAWVKERFVPPEYSLLSQDERFARIWWKDGRLFVPARLEDNPSLDKEAYVATLQNLDPITRQQLLAGDWDAYQGGRFQRSWFERRWRMNPAGNYWLGRIDVNGCRVWDKDDWVGPAYCWRFGIVDPAATEKETADYTTIGVYAVTPDNRFLILDFLRERLAIDRIPDAIASKCEQWELAWVGIEAVGGFKGLLATCRADVRCGAVRELMTEGKGKLARATPAIIRAESGGLYLPEQAPWAEEWIGEHVQFTGDDRLDAYSDQVDNTAYACGAMVGLGGMYADCPVKEYPTGEPEAEKEPQRNAEGRGLFGLGDEPQAARSAFGRGRRRGFMGR